MVSKGQCAAIGIAMLVAGCKPEFDDRTALIEGPRVLGVQSTPAEGTPGSRVVLRALYVDPTGTPAEAPIDWAICRERKPLTELGPINTACLKPSSPELVDLGRGIEVTGTLLPDACRLFGPNPPEAKRGEAAGRPVDPDSSGGFYVPTRLRVLDDGVESYATGQTRVACDPGRVTPEQAREFRRRYRPNENPRIAELAIARGSGDAIVLPASEQARPKVAAGELLTLRVSWPECPLEAACGDGICGADEDVANCAPDCAGVPRGCAGAEPYVAFDTLTLALQSRRETIRASWFASQGQFDIPATGNADAALTQSANQWRAPDVAGVVHLWVVLRDDRHGIGWQAYDVEVE